MTEKEKGEMMRGLVLAATMCQENRDGCRSCIFNRTYAGCMFQSKRYPARWDLEGRGRRECQQKCLGK